MANPSQEYCLAEVSVAFLKPEVNPARMADFREVAEPVFALARVATGHLWEASLEGPAEMPLSFPGTTDDKLVHMSLWGDLDAIMDFSFSDEHRAAVKAFGNRFWSLLERHVALWWVPRVGTDLPADLPTLEVADAKLDLLKRQGDSAKVFDFDTAHRYSNPHALFEIN
jgi:hypothetical protein